MPRSLSLVLAPLVMWFAAGCERQSLALLPAASDAAVPLGSGDGARRDAGSVRAEPAGSADAGALFHECDRSNDCGGYRPHCDTSTFRCVECLSPAHCDAPLTCDSLSKRCTLPCTTSRDCRGESPYCDASRGLCVECRDDYDCTSTYARFCSTTTGQCVECLNDDHCKDPEPVCDPVRLRCVPAPS